MNFITGNEHKRALLLGNARRNSVIIVLNDNNNAKARSRGKRITRNLYLARRES